MLRARSIAVLKFLGFNIKILATQVSGLIRLPQAEIYVDPKTLSQGLELLILEYSHLSQLLKLYTREGGKPILNRLSQPTSYHQYQVDNHVELKLLKNHLSFFLRKNTLVWTYQKWKRANPHFFAELSLDTHNDF